MTSQSEVLGALIWRHWQDGTVMEALPAELLPRDKAAAYAAQATLERFSAHPRAGWKIAATSKAGQRHIGVSGPLCGRLLVENLRQDGAEVSLAQNRMRVAEPEFAFRFGDPITARENPFTVDDVMNRVSDLHLAIELPDSRFADFASAGGDSLIADNACARELVLGPAVTADWRGLDLSAYTIRAQVGNRYERDGIGSNVLGDPRIALTWCVNELTGLGIEIAAGEVVTTGTCAVPLEIIPGDHVEIDYGILGRIGVSFPKDQ